MVPYGRYSYGYRNSLGRGGLREPLAINAQVFGSAMFPLENGRTTDTSTKNGQFITANFRTQASGPGSTAPYWNGAYAAIAICDPHRSRVDGQNFLPHVFGTTDGTTNPRSTGLRYYPLQHSTAARRQRFEFFVFGEGAVGAWTSQSAVIPTSAKGPFAVYCYNDNTNQYVHVYDIDSGTWYDGAAVAKPASWVGVSAAAFTSNLGIGAAGDRALGTNYGPSYQSTSVWRGSIGDVIFANSALSKANVESIVNGSNPVTVVTGAGATVYCHFPLTSGGALSSTVNTTFTGVTITAQGNVLQGATLKRQDATNYITLKRFLAGEHFPVANGSSTGRIKLEGNVGGLTGTLRYRVVRQNGVAVQNWRETGITPAAGVFSGHVTVPEFTGKAQVQVAMSDDMTVIASSHVDCTCGPVVEVHAQSEGLFATFFGNLVNGVNSTLAPTIPSDGDTVTFAHIIDAANDIYSLYSAVEQPGLIGDGSAALVNYIRSKTSRSILIRVNAVSGTSPLALMNDADTTRSWADLVGIRNLTSATGASSESVVTGHVIYGWEASLSPVDVMPVAYQPLLTGVGASSGVYDRTSNIPTADIDHYLFDGSSSANARVVFSPSNRQTVGAGAGTTDAVTGADRRDHFRNYSDLYGYTVAPETVAHRMEGETAAGGLPAGSVTHPEPNVWEGVPETGVTLAEAVLLAAGIGTYPGPVFFETITAGTAANKVKVRLGLPRPNPGDGIATGAAGYSTAAQSGSYTYALHVKKNGGNAGSGFEASIDGGAYSKANVTSGTITDAATGEVELTLASTPATSVAIRYLPGSPGRYSAGTITQDNWRAGLLYFSGVEYAAGEPNSVDDLTRLGWQVAGSNQALMLAL